jgi:biotin carboxylase
MKKVLLVCSETWDSVSEIPFIFKKGGCTTVDVLCPADAWLRHNSFCDTWIEIKKQPEEVQNQLKAIANDPQKPYDKIHMLDEKIIDVMNHSTLTDHEFAVIMPVTDPENRLILSSKSGFSQTCEKFGIATPKFRVYQEDIPLADQVRELTFPLMIKEDLSWGGGGIRYCANWAELVEGLKQARTKKNLVLQEYIVGEEIRIDALFYNGQLVTYNSASALSYYASSFTYTTRRLYFRDPKIEALLAHMGKSFTLNSFANISCIYHPERNIHYLIEVDTRTNNWMPYSRFTGFNFADGVKLINQYWPSPIPEQASQSTLKSKPIEIAVFYRDLRRCVKQKDVKGLLRWIFNYRGYWRFIPFYDPRLLRRIFAVMFRDLAEKILPKFKTRLAAYSRTF